MQVAQLRRIQPRRTETRLTTTMRLPHHSRDRKRKGDRRRTRRKVWWMTVLLLSRAWNTRVPPNFVLAPVPVASSTVAVVNDDVDALPNRKRVSGSVPFTFVTSHRLTGNGPTAGFSVVLTDEECEETEGVRYAGRSMAHRSAVADNRLSATPLARGGSVRSLRISAIQSSELTLDIEYPTRAPREQISIQDTLASSRIVHCILS
jgi:hypothetical protein